MRWETVGEDEGADALFDADSLAERHVGRGEFRGTEFLHVRAKRIISEVPKASRMPFRHTINVYRGCSHACTYCLGGDTPILMGDGTTTPLADVRPGDEVFGTASRGRRRYVRTVVLDHWSTRKPAWRIQVRDGTVLLAGADHRFLTAGGWKYVTGAGHGASGRAHLVVEDRLLGPGRFVHPAGVGGGLPVGTVRGGAVGPHQFATAGRRAGASGPVRLRLEGVAVGGDAALDVVAIQPTGQSLPLYDLTTGTGDFIAAGVVSHNCFARPTHEYLGLGIGEDFETRIVVKINAVECLRAELAARRWSGHHIAMGTNTDPYQRCEGKYHLTRGVVETLAEAGNPFSILTKSTLVLRDLDLLAGAARRSDVRVNLSIGTLDDDVWRLTEPGTPRPRARVDAVRRLNEAGVPCGVLVAPVLPGLSDREEQLRAVVEACTQAGAVSISAVALHLRPGVREHYLGWLRGVDPALAAATEARYRGAYLPKAEQEELRATVHALVASAGGRPQSPRQARRVGRDLMAGVRAEIGGDEPSRPPTPAAGNEQLALDW